MYAFSLQRWEPHCCQFFSVNFKLFRSSNFTFNFSFLLFLFLFLQSINVQIFHRFSKFVRINKIFDSHFTFHIFFFSLALVFILAQFLRWSYNFSLTMLKRLKLSHTADGEWNHYSSYWDDEKEHQLISISVARIFFGILRFNTKVFSPKVN